MDKRTFLKTSGLMVAGSLLPQLQARQGPRKNWAGNYTYKAKELSTAGRTGAIQTTIRSTDKVKALGSRHSFNNIADTSGMQISLEKQTNAVLDKDLFLVDVDAGVAYGRLAPYLHQRGFAVHNLASLPHISIAGACATGTHGSGSKLGNLSTAVTGLELVSGDNNITRLSRDKDGEQFNGVVVALGALGVVTKVTLQVEKAFEVRQDLYQNLSFSQLEKNLDEIFASGYSVSLFTDWQKGQASQVWIKRRLDQEVRDLGSEFFGAKRATRKLHPLTDHPSENCTDQMGIAGPWYERLPHFKMDFTPSSGEELQAEYFVPRNRAYEAIRAIEELRDQITPHLFISELRTIAADHLWLSPCYQRDSLAIHFTWKPHEAEVRKLLPVIEEKLAPFEARPHWAKLFHMSYSRFKVLYEKLPDFQRLMRYYDPAGKFRNEYLERNLIGS